MMTTTDKRIIIVLGLLVVHLAIEQSRRHNRRKRLVRRLKDMRL